MKIYSLIRKHPFIRFVFPLIIGILTTTVFYTYFHSIYKIVFVSGLFFISSTIILTTTNSLKAFQKYFIITSFYLLGGIITYYNLYTPTLNSKEQKWVGTIYNKPEQKTSSYLIQVKLPATQFSGTIKKTQRVQLYTKIDSVTASKIRVGQSITFSSTISRIENRNNPDEFDYARFMAGKRILLQTYCPPENIAVSKNVKRTIPFILNKVQCLAQNTYQKYIDDKDALAVINALALGDKQFLNDDIRQSYVNAGAIHVLAVSGLHIGIVFAFANYLFFFLNRTKRQRTLKIILTITVIWAYAALTGLSPSVNRAATMFTLISIGKNLNREISYFNILAFAAFILLIINPLSLYHIGFQLSFIAVGGIVYFQPKLYSLLTIRNKIFNEIYKVITVSVAAQLATTPLILYYFHQFPTYFWITNLLLIYLICASLVLAVLLLLVGWIPFLSSGIAFVLQYIIRGTNKWVQIIESLPYSTIENIHIHIATVFGLFFILIFMSIWEDQKKVRYLNYTIGSILIMQICLIAIDSTPTKNQVIFYNQNKSSYIGIFNGEQNILFYQAPEPSHQLTLKYYFRSHWQKQKVDSCQQTPIDSLILNDENKMPFIQLPNNSTILLYNSDKLEVPSSFNSNYIYVCKNLWPPKTRLKTNTILLGNTLSVAQKRAWVYFASKDNIDIVDLNDGAIAITL